MQLIMFLGTFHTLLWAILGEIENGTSIMYDDMCRMDSHNRRRQLVIVIYGTNIPQK